MDAMKRIEEDETFHEPPLLNGKTNTARIAAY